MPSIGVLEHFQKPTDKPTRRIKRSGGQSLVRQGLAEWLRPNVLLRMIAHKHVNALAGMPIKEIHIEPEFDYDYPANEFPHRTFWRQPLLIHYPIADQRS